MFNLWPAVAAMKRIRDVFEFRIVNGQPLAATKMIEPGCVDEVLDIASLVFGIPEQPPGDRSVS